MVLRQKVIRALRNELGPVEDLLEETPSGRITGVIISAAFGGLDHHARQQRIIAALKHSLTKAEFAHVGAIAVLTPGEAKLKAS